MEKQRRGERWEEWRFKKIYENHAVILIYKHAIIYFICVNKLVLQPLLLKCSRLLCFVMVIFLLSNITLILRTLMISYNYSGSCVHVKLQLTIQYSIHSIAQSLSPKKSLTINNETQRLYGYKYMLRRKM